MSPEPVSGEERPAQARQAGSNSGLPGLWRRKTSTFLPLAQTPGTPCARLYPSLWDTELYIGEFISPLIPYVPYLYSLRPSLNLTYPPNLS